jgi:hypothetical protein
MYFYGLFKNTKIYNLTVIRCNLVLRDYMRVSAHQCGPTLTTSQISTKNLRDMMFVSMDLRSRIAYPQYSSWPDKTAASQLQPMHPPHGTVKTKICYFLPLKINMLVQNHRYIYFQIGESRWKSNSCTHLYISYPAGCSHVSTKPWSHDTAGRVEKAILKGFFIDKDRKKLANLYADWRSW